MFNLLKPENYPELKRFFDKHQYLLCEYSLSSILAWNRCVYEVSWKLDGDLLLIAETDLEPPAARRLLMPLPFPFRELPPRELADIAIRNRHLRYFYIPQDYIDKNLPEIKTFFTIEEQPGFMDYIYNSADLSSLAGHKYAKKRNLIAQFNKQTAAPGRVCVAAMTSANNLACLPLLDAWAGKMEIGAGMGMLHCERKAIIRALKYFDLLEMAGVMVFIDGRICGFAFGSRLSDGIFVLNFEKALDHVKGLYQFLDNELAKHLPARYALINKESDLNEPGLAKAKESYYPARKVKSYMLTLNTENVNSRS